MRVMPRLSTPREMPREVVDLVDVIGNHARTEILRRLSAGPLSAMELAAVLDIHHASVHRHLVRLEEHGLVTASTDAEPGHRRGNKGVRWSVVPERVEQLGRQWIEYASGSDSETPADGRPKARGTGPS